MIESPELNFGQIFFMTLGFLPVLACFPCWVVAKFVYEPYIKQLAEESKHIVDEPVSFEYQFPIDKAGNTKDKDSEFKNCIVLSNTPKGMVYMRYSKEDEGFGEGNFEALFKSIERDQRRRVQGPVDPLEARQALRLGGRPGFDHFSRGERDHQTIAIFAGRPASS